jgi:hypothetical protein
MYEAGAGWDEIAAALPHRTRAALKQRAQLAGWKRGYKEHAHTENSNGREALIAFLKDAPRTLAEVSAKFDRSAETCRTWIDELTASGYNVVETPTCAEVSTKALPPAPIVEKLLRFNGLEFGIGICADLHGGSTAEQPSALHAFTRRAYDAGVRNMLVAGDIFAGYGVYRGQANDLYIVRADGQIAAGASRIPQMDGLDWWMLGGNHDFSFIKGGGPCALRALCALRPDIHFVGYDSADIPITDRVDARLWHPRGGLPYAISYRLQKGMEATAFEALRLAIAENANPKLRLVVGGHIHLSTMLPIGGIVGFQAGCFEMQNNLLRAMGRFPEIGGWIVRVRLEDSGWIAGISGEWVQYKPIVDDWKNYPMPQELTPKLEPLFTLA